MIECVLTLKCVYALIPRTSRIEDTSEVYLSFLNFTIEGSQFRISYGLS